MKRSVLLARSGFFDLDNRYESSSKLDVLLDVLDQYSVRNVSYLRSKALRKFKKSNALRKPYDSIFYVQGPCIA
jgi:hypothetical protein